MRCRCFYLLFCGLAIAGVAADQWSKYAVFRWLGNQGQGGDHEIVEGWFRLTAQFTGSRVAADGFRAPFQKLNGEFLPRVNHGALFGLGGRFEVHANSFFMIVSVLAATAILIWSRRPSVTRDGVLSGALGLILAGTLGNLFDRAVFGGVRDFLYFYWIDWPVFNVADCCLVCGAGLLLIQAFWPHKSECQVAEPTAARQMTEPTAALLETKCSTISTSHMGVK